ncbi:hypothetical protein DFR76_102409 [Nocardia pseudobrasiliensis]|uniref:Uncharacterized protein n=1 Tax=Nocardia pseudobrasiliensis TaxID=45979 RepID=A0A370IBC1_9NOCA|nr:hypothetical protein DFR76_102409 [Nocardia pseudobrasiliensis]
MESQNMVALAAMDTDPDLIDDAPISVFSVAYCDDAYFG